MYLRFGAWVVGDQIFSFCRVEFPVSSQESRLRCRASELVVVFKVWLLCAFQVRRDSDCLEGVSIRASRFGVCRCC